MSSKRRMKLKRYLATICIAAALLVPTIAPITATSIAASSHHAKQYRNVVTTAQAYFQVLNT